MREPNPEGNAEAGSSGASTILPAIAVLLLIGLALRLIIAYVLLPGSGFPSDLSSFQGWSSDLVRHTPLGFYNEPGFLDYPPVYLLFLYAAGLPGGGIGEGVKLIPIFADLALAAVVYVLVLDFGASRSRALVAAGVVLFNPVAWFNSAIWGQADAVGSVFMLLGLRALLQDRRELSAALAVVAALTKIQLGILGFLVGFVILRRSLAPREGSAEPERVLTSIASGIGTGAVICLPFTGLDLLGLPARLSTLSFALTALAALATAAGAFLWVRRNQVAGPAYSSLAAAVLAVVAFGGMILQSFDAIGTHIINTFGEYPYLTLNAYNPWALLTDESGSSMARNLGWVHDATWQNDAGASLPGFTVGPFSVTVTMLAIGAALLLIGLAFAAWQWARWRDQGLVRPDESDDEDEAALSADVEPETDGGADGAPRFSLSSELRALAVACLIGIGLIVFLFGSQLVGPLPASLVGSVLLLATILGTCAWAAWRDDKLSIVVALAILAIAFFVVPTRSHERYLFPFFAVGAVLLALSMRWALFYVVLAIVNSANLVSVLQQYCGIPTDNPYPCIGQPSPLGGGNQALSQMLIDWGSFLHDARFGDFVWPIALSAVVMGAAFLWALAQMRDRARRLLAFEAEGAGEAAVWEVEDYLPEGATQRSAAPSPQMAGAPATAGMAAAATASERGNAAFAAAPPPPPPPPPPPSGPGGGDFAYEDEFAYEERAYTDDNPEFVPGPVMRLWRHLFRPSLRPDRSAALAHEPRGRLDKLDLWLVTLLALSLLFSRVYRLDEPAQMHFDEVYHARTATEFLQEWRFGIPHSIYEYTHPHLAKYSIGAGITFFSDYKVTATSELGVPVKDVVVQPRTPPSESASPDGNPLYDPNARLGDRAFVATGTGVNVYDLETRELVWTYPIARATTLSLAAGTGYIYAGTSDGHIYRIDTSSLDDLRLGRTKTPDKAVDLPGNAGIQIVKLYAGSPPFILAADAKGEIVSLDGTGKIVGRGSVDGLADLVPMGTSPASLTFMPGQVSDPAAEAQVLSEATGFDAAQIEAMLGVPAVTGPPIRLDLGQLDPAMVANIQAAADDNKLPGITLWTNIPQVLVAYQGGLALLNVQQVFITSNVYSASPTTSIAINTNSSQDSYVAAGQGVLLIKADQAGGSVTIDGGQSLQTMPGLITKVVFDDSTKLVHALGRSSDGKGWAFYSIETNGNAVFDEATLPFRPAAIGLDASPQLPAFDRQQMLVFDSNGAMASVNVGQFAFSWRIVGVLFGVLMGVCLFLLTRLLFKRRVVGVLVGIFTCLDGMFFVQSRIAMNDTYVGGLLLLGYLIFALLWLNGDAGGRRRWLAFWLGLPLLGVVMGLALAAKWVALYAIASMGVLILARSALGRLIVILGLAFATGSFGWAAIAEMTYGTRPPAEGNYTQILLLLLLAAGGIVLTGAYLVRNRARTQPDKWLFAAVTAVLAGAVLWRSLAFYPPADQNGAPNYTFFLIMFTLTMVAAAINAYHPVAWTRAEMWFAIVAPGVLGALVAAILGAMHLAGVTDVSTRTLALLAGGGVGLGVAAGAIFAVAGRFGFGPLAVQAPPEDPAAYAEAPSPAPRGWLNLGSGFGLPAFYMMLCMLVLPIAVYIGMYVPWVMPWQPETPQSGPLPVLMCFKTDASTGACTDAWPAGHSGQTLFDLTIGMYNYHNDLRATHAASSPWWSWPMDLKPVWFESDSYALNTGSMIYDGGNPVLWWLAIAAMAFLLWQAFKRRSLGLALIAVAFLWQWLSWARIDRASFQYHFYTALPFFLMGLAYFMAELWHGPSRRTWLLARIAAAVALLFPPLLWLGKGQLCELARVSTADYFGQSACGVTQGNLVVEERMFWIAVILVLALGWLLFTMVRLERNADEEGNPQGYGWVFQLLAPVAIAGAVLVWLGQNGSHSTLFEVPLSAQFVVLALLALFVVMAFVVVTALDPRRYVLGFLAAAFVAFLVLYPNLSALVMPGNITSAYNGFLPTWLYGFQFSVNMQPAAGVSPISLTSMMVTGLVLGVAMLIAYAAWIKRVVAGYGRHLATVDGLAIESGEGREHPAGDEPSA